MSDTQRVRAWVRQRPTTIQDWDRFPACDGGKRITRLAARIQDLKDDGCVFDREMVSLGDSKVARYTLIFDPLAQPSGPPVAVVAPEDQETLFALPSEPHYREAA